MQPQKVGKIILKYQGKTVAAYPNSRHDTKSHATSINCLYNDLYVILNLGVFEPLEELYIDFKGP